MHVKKSLKLFELAQQKKVFLIGGVVLVAALLFGNEGFRRMISSSRRLAVLRTEIFRLKGERTVLQKELQLLEHDMTYVERLARKELGLIQPGEIEFRFVPSKSEKDSD